MIIEKRVLTGLGVSGRNADAYLADLNQILPAHRIDTPLRTAHFLAQVVHESGGFTFIEENMNYSAERLLEVFPSRFTPDEALAYARQPERIGSRVYGNRMGNGSEASGDGYRFRGRGLIQLTGRNNYRDFSRWIGQDVVAHPRLVAEKFAVHSAVFFWTANDITPDADADDVRSVTLKINGGLNGLGDRTRLLDRARALLNVDAAAVEISDPTHRVAATALNLRRLPRVMPSTRITSLPQGKPVLKVADAEISGWMQIRTVIGGRIMEGFVATRHLEALEASPPPVPPAPAGGIRIPAPHLSEGRSDITRARDGGRAHPLGEADRPRRRSVAAGDKVRELMEIIRYLDVENAAHRRYKPQGRTTFCNIYAYDYACLSGVFLPRVWWTPRALLQIDAQDPPPVRYDDTVRELNANMLHDWFDEYGPTFGWRRELHLDVLQAAADGGEVCIIVAKRRDLNRSGHITAVAPENGGFEAARSRTGVVLRPLESQAGTTNHNFITRSRAWWQDSRFQSHGFWRHA